MSRAEGVRFVTVSDLIRNEIVAFGLDAPPPSHKRGTNGPAVSPSKFIITRQMRAVAGQGAVLF